MNLNYNEPFYMEKPQGRRVEQESQVWLDFQPPEGARGLEKFFLEDHQEDDLMSSAQMSRSMELLKRADGERKNIADIYI